MAFQRQTFPLYLHITAVSILLVLLAVAVRRWLGGDVAELSVFLPLLAIAIVLAVLLAHRISRSLARLAEEAEAVRRFDFSDHPVIRSSVREVIAWRTAST